MRYVVRIITPKSESFGDSKNQSLVEEIGSNKLAVVLAMAKYSSSVDERATVCCFLANHETEFGLNIRI